MNSDSLIQCTLKVIESYVGTIYCMRSVQHLLDARILSQNYTCFWFQWIVEKNGCLIGSGRTEIGRMFVLWSTLRPIISIFDQVTDIRALDKTITEEKENWNGFHRTSSWEEKRSMICYQYWRLRNPCLKTTRGLKEQFNDSWCIPST